METVLFYFLLSALLRNSFLCWDSWNVDMTPTLDAALLCSSRAGSDLGRESGLGYISSALYPTPRKYLNYLRTSTNF